MKIWILQTGEPLHIDHDDPRPMRGMNLADKLIEKGHEVTLWSTKFNHRLKEQRPITDNDIIINKNLKIKLISSPGYKSNISLGRIYDHIILGLNLRKKLKSVIELPHIAFLGYPPIEINFFMVNFLHKKNIPFIVDVKDQWPDFFLQAFPRYIKPLGRVAIFPFKVIAISLLSKASGITSMSQSFLNWSLKYINRDQGKFDIVVPLTTKKNDPINFTQHLKWWEKFNIFNDGIPNILFIGSHYPSLDFDTIIDAAKILANKNIKCNFILCGEGELTSEIRKKTINSNNIILPGWVNKSQIDAIASISTVTICPFKNIDNYIINIPNKILDALSLGLPILSPLKGEVANLIKDRKVGLTYTEFSKESLSSNIIKIINDKKLCEQLSINSKKTYDELYDFNTVYDNLVMNLEELSNTP